MGLPWSGDNRLPAPSSASLAGVAAGVPSSDSRLRKGNAATQRRRRGDDRERLEHDGRRAVVCRATQRRDETQGLGRDAAGIRDTAGREATRRSDAVGNDDAPPALGARLAPDVQHAHEDLLAASVERVDVAGAGGGAAGRSTFRRRWRRARDEREAQERDARTWSRHGHRTCSDWPAKRQKAG